MSYRLDAAGAVFAPLVSDDAGTDNAPILEAAIAAAPRGVVWIKPGHYYFSTEPSLELDSWAIIGPSPAHHAQLTEVSGDSHAHAIFEYTGSGTFMTVTPTLPAGGANRDGPYVLKNLMIKGTHASSNLVLIGNTSDATRSSAQTTGVHIEGCNFANDAQIWAVSRDPVALIDTADDGVRTSADTFCLKIIKGYDTVVRDCAFRGGYRAMQLIHCDSLHVEYCRFQHNVFGLQIKGIDDGSTDTGSVPGSVNHCYAEHFEGCGLWIDSGTFTNYRGETGNNTSVGRYATPDVTGWAIAAPAAGPPPVGKDEITLTHAVGVPTDFFLPDMPVTFVDHNTGYEYTVLVKEVSDAPTPKVTFYGAATNSEFPAAITSTGAVYRYFGSHVIMKGPKISGSNLSMGFNKVIADLPILFFMPEGERSSLFGMPNVISWADRSNRIKICAHNPGPQSSMRGGLDIFGGCGDYLPEQTNPFVNVFGHEPSDTNQRSSASVPAPNRPGEYWHFYAGDGAGASDYQGQKIICQFEELGRYVGDAEGFWYEDWDVAGSRRFGLYGLQEAATTYLRYRIKCKSNSGGAETVPVQTIGSATVTHSTHTIGTDWAWYGGEISTTAFASITSTSGMPALNFNQADVLFAELIVERLELGMSSATTTDATVTTLDSFPTTSDSVYHVTATVLATETVDHDEVASYQLIATFKNDGGVLTQIGTTTTIFAESTSGWNCDIDDDGSTTIRLRVTGAAATNVNWQGKLDWQRIT